MSRSQGLADESRRSPGAFREVRFEYSTDFPVVLSQLKIALLASTYQAGKLAVIGTRDGKETFEFHHVMVRFLTSLLHYPP